MNPENSKNIDKITPFLLHIIKHKNIGLEKHYIIIKNIDLLSRIFYDFRILLEKYSHNINVYSHRDYCSIFSHIIFDLYNAKYFG